MERELATHLLTLARLFGAHEDLSLSTLGRKCAWDGRFFENLEDPTKSFTARKYDEVLAFFAAHWPEEGLAWPDGIGRPAKEEWQRIVEAAKARAARRAPAQPEAAA